MLLIYYDIPVYINIYYWNFDYLNEFIIRYLLIYLTDLCCPLNSAIVYQTSNMYEIILWCYCPLCFCRKSYLKARANLVTPWTIANKYSLWLLIYIYSIHLFPWKCYFVCLTIYMKLLNYEAVLFCRVGNARDKLW